MSIQSLEGGLAQTALPPYGVIADGATLEPGAGPAVSSDAISLSPAQPETGSNLDQASMLSPLSGMLTQLMQMLQSMLGNSSASFAGMPGQCSPYNGQGSGTCAPGGDGIAHGAEQYFSSAQGQDEGDPHLTFNGAKWNSMVSHPNLLQSNSVPGGYRVSTQVGNPNAQGITRNKSAQILLDGGRTTVGLNGEGQPSIVRNGENIPISPGQTVNLGHGSSVTCKQDGALCVDSHNAAGGQISTTLSTKKGGVDVAVNAQNVDLGGALVRGQKISPGPEPAPTPTTSGSPGQYLQPPIVPPEPFALTQPASYEQPNAFQQPETYE
ncbi:MAG TPA: hypothetical protein VGK84_13400 [Candidatus Tumulicola sp.]|jgi:hypothetical protein